MGFNPGEAIFNLCGRWHCIHTTKDGIHGYRPETLLAGAITLTPRDAVESIRYVSIAAILARIVFGTCRHRNGDHQSFGFIEQLYRVGNQDTSYFSGLRSTPSATSSLSALSVLRFKTKLASQTSPHELVSLRTWHTRSWTTR